MALRLRIFCLIFALIPGMACADPAPFDLAGPVLEVTVDRAGRILPIAEVPNLAVGDKLSIKADLPPGQSAHYLLVAAFLRGATNPPPEDWFGSAETWTPKGREGLKITVPPGAQQVLVFLAPSTSGDLRTIVGAVRGQPGSFVRASQDLNQATLDRARLKAYMAAIRKLSESDASALQNASPLLARSLMMKFDPNCMQKIPELQAPCLMQGQDSLILNDGHSTTVVEGVTNGYGLDLAEQVGFTKQGGYGLYSPYIAAVADMARIMDSFRTAQFRYIPALATEQKQQLSLELNAPPSFHSPKSVLVVALPAVAPPQLPPLRPVDPKQVYCAEQTELVLPTEGAPLVFATGYAHDMVLHLKGKDGRFVDLQVKADPEKGGFVANTTGVSPSNFGDVLDGSLSGYWGFEPYSGPEFHLENTHPEHWQIVNADQSPVIAGQDAELDLATENAACVDSILLERPGAESVKADWKPTGPNQVAVKISLKKMKPGAMKLLVKQYGSKEPDVIPFQAFAPAGHLESFAFHAGDDSGVLRGSALDDVVGLSLNDIAFKPGPMTHLNDAEELTMMPAKEGTAAALREGESATAKVELRDGRTLSLAMTVGSPRPRVTLLGSSVQPPPAGGSTSLDLSAPDELPQGAILTFSVHAQVPDTFSGSEKIEISTARGANLATLTPSNGLTLEDPQVALATLDTGSAFAPSASGPLRFRVVENGVPGNWQPLATLVRLPQLRELKCPEAPDAPCKLSGSKLYLMDSISADAGFTHPVQVPVGFTGYALSVPRPVSGALFVKLHDDPGVVNSAAFPGQGGAPAVQAGKSQTPAPAAPAPAASAPPPPPPVPPQGAAHAAPAPSAAPSRPATAGADSPAGASHAPDASQGKKPDAGQSGPGASTSGSTPAPQPPAPQN